MVILQLEQHRLRGRFGRLLAHVILQDRSTLNEAMLAAGLARIDERFMHGKEAHYRLIAQQAAFDRVGLYGQTSD
jgi:endonuclease YncB( thermonuclease family)